MNNLNSDYLRLEIAILQEEIDAFNPPNKAKFIIPVIMTDRYNAVLAAGTSNILNKKNGNIRTASVLNIKNTVTLEIPLEYTFTYGADTIPVGTRFIITFVGANVNDIKIVGRYDSANEVSSETLDIIKNIKSIIKDIYSNISRIDTELTRINGEIERINQSIEQIQSDIVRIDQSIEDINTNIERIDNTIEQLSTDIDTMKSDISRLDAIVEQIQTDISSVTESVEQLQTDVSRIDETVSQHTTDISDINEDISRIDETVSQHTTDISGLDSRLSTLENTTIAELIARIESLEADRIRVVSQQIINDGGND